MPFILKIKSMTSFAETNINETEIIIQFHVRIFVSNTFSEELNGALHFM